MEGESCGCCAPAREPEGADPVKGRDEGDAIGREPEFLGGQQHLATNEVVCEQQAPDLLADALGLEAPQRLLPLEHVRFQLVVGDFQLPPLVVQRDEFVGGPPVRVKQSGEQAALLADLVAIGDDAGNELGGQVRVGAARGWREMESPDDGPVRQCLHHVELLV